MNVRTTRESLEELLRRSEEMKRQFAQLVLLSKQMLDEKDLVGMRDIADATATNFDTIASFLYSFGREGAPKGKRISKLN